MRIFYLLLAASFLAYSQAPPAVHEFLNLTQEQFVTITQNNESFNSWSQEKQRRIHQVQREIAEWTAAEPLDPTQLGVRYAEIEAICRRMVNESLRYRKLNREALNQEQLAKLAVLEEVLRLHPTAASAVGANLLAGAATPSPFFGPNRWFNTGAFVLGPTVPGCQSPVVPGFVIRSPFPQTDQPR
ncbi:MAG: hypothetical protein GY953_11770 [bacterium]|nr:hypothetical protein [bacterium]